MLAGLRRCLRRHQRTQRSGPWTQTSADLVHPMKIDTESFATLVKGDRERAQRICRQVCGDPIDPQFRIATPDGDCSIALPLGDDPQSRAIAWGSSRSG